MRQPIVSMKTPRAMLALAISLALLLVPWIQVFLLRLNLSIAVATVLGFDLIILVFLVVTNRPAPETDIGDLKAPVPLAFLAFISVFVLLETDACVFLVLCGDGTG